MRARLLLSFCAVLCAARAASASAVTWDVTGGTLTYTVTHPLHVVHGVSRVVRGRAVCDGVCSVLVAAPVESFGSQDANRDLHMLQVVRGAAFPTVAVQAKGFAAPPGGASDAAADLDVSFAGKRHLYKGVALTLEGGPDHVRVRGTVPLRLTDFGIDRPAFLTVAIKDECPIEFDVLWKKGTPKSDLAPSRAPAGR